MKQNKPIEVEEKKNLQEESSNEDIFNEIIWVLRQNFIAIFTKENTNSLLMRFLNGKEVRISMEEVFASK